MNDLVAPCKKYIKDKLNIELENQDIIKYIKTASINLSLTEENLILTKDEKKLILSNVYDLVNKDNNLEYVLETLENERNNPVVSIPFDFEDNYTQPAYHYKTLLIQSNKSNFEYNFNNVSRLLPYKIFVRNNNPIISVWINDNLFHFYKKNINDIIYHTINDVENIPINNTATIKLENIQNNFNYTIHSLRKIDENHYKIIILNNNNKEKSDIRIYSNNKIYNFYYVDNDIYLAEDTNININPNNSIVVLTSNIIYILCKVIKS
jgi:hypothetical protein